MASTYVSRVVCEPHNFVAVVGRAVRFALDYYECPQCIREQDEAYERARRPCCSRMNIDCVGHDEQRAWMQTIDSPNYCSGHEDRNPPF
jgi:hypothetical protein